MEIYVLDTTRHDTTFCCIARRILWRKSDPYWNEKFLVAPIHFCGIFWRSVLFAADSIASCGRFTFAADFEAEQVGVASFASCANFAADLVIRVVSCQRRERRNIFFQTFFIFFLKKIKIYKILLEFLFS